MSKFTGHKNEDSIVIRGSMNHAVKTTTEFKEWLRFEGCTRGGWKHSGGTPLETCLVRRSDGSVLCVAMRLHADAFETVY